MTSTRSPLVLLVAASLLLLANLGVLLTSDDLSFSIDGDPSASADVNTGPNGLVDGKPGEDGQGVTPGDDSATDDGTQTTSDDATGTDEGASSDDGADDGAGDEGDDEGGDDATDGDDPAEDGLTLPAEGSYTYASEGTWSFQGGTYDVAEILPDTTDVVVTNGPGSWGVTITAGPKYQESFTFRTSDAGLAWFAWDFKRDLSDGRGLQPTGYICDETPVYDPTAAPGTVTQHVCNGSNITSTGTVTYRGLESVTLGDGSTVEAARITYETVDSGASTGSGTLEFWLDPGTGLRLKESRDMSSTSEVDGIQYVYSETVSFTLLSLTPS